MSDRHVRILAMAARLSQRRLDAHDAAGETGPVAREARGKLRVRAASTRARLRAARARRAQPQDDA